MEWLNKIILLKCEDGDLPVNKAWAVSVSETVRRFVAMFDSGPSAPTSLLEMDSIPFSCAAVENMWVIIGGADQRFTAAGMDIHLLIDIITYFDVDDLVLDFILEPLVCSMYFYGDKSPVYSAAYKKLCETSPKLTHNDKVKAVCAALIAK